jgi:protein-disulfide isomerase
MVPQVRDANRGGAGRRRDMSDGTKRLDRMQRAVNLAAGVSVVALAGTLTVSALTGSLCTVGTTVAGEAGRADVAPPPPPAARFVPPAEPVAFDEAYTVGRPNAPVTLIEYSDFRCPFCARFARETLPALEAAFVESGRLRVAYKHLPIPQLHPDAPLAAEAAECAGRAGRFREMHDALFAEPGRLTGGAMVTAALALGLDEASFRACLTDGETRERVGRDTAEARALGITGTPAFLVGTTEPDGRVRVTEVISGARPIEAFREAIERALAAAAAR